MVSVISSGRWRRGSRSRCSGFEDLELRGSPNVAGRDGAGTLLRDVHLDLGRIAVRRRDEVLEVEHDVGPRSSRTPGSVAELVRRALDLHRGDCSAPSEESSTLRIDVAECVSEAAGRAGLDDEDPAILVGPLPRGRSSGSESPLRRVCQRNRFPFCLFRVELDDELFLNRPYRSRRARRCFPAPLPVRPSWSA